MRILALATDVSARHGIGAYTLQTLSGLGVVRPGWRTTVVTLGADASAHLPDGYVLRRCTSKLDFGLAGVAVALRTRPRKILVFHVSLMPVAWICAAVSGAEVILFTHGWEISHNRRFVDRYFAGKASRLISVSRRTALDLDAFLICSRRHGTKSVSLLPPTFDELRYQVTNHDQGEVRQRLGIERSDAVLLTVGRLEASERGKGHDRVIRALPQLAQRYPNIRYLIVGEGNNSQRLRAIANRLGVSDRTRFVGFASDLRDFYSVADVFVMPSTQEGFGIAFLEALACGVPVVAGGIDGSPTPLSWGLDGFLCDPYCEASVVDAILAALDSRTAGDPRGDSARLAMSVREDFGTAAFEDRLDALLRASV